MSCPWFQIPEPSLGDGVSKLAQNLHTNSTLLKGGQEDPREIHHQAVRPEQGRSEAGRAGTGPVWPALRQDGRNQSPQLQLRPVQGVWCTQFT
jgi:hypothetical protein